ncbi:MAG: TMEM165/GDT1 family protein, partial [Alphaproteobacteria bacterium]|nr:TMEM165/GDT1 family protein [Alphaproteobacteria bacterium]
LVATAANHTVAAWLGLVVADLLTPEVLRWVLIASFAAMAGWTLIPDKLDDKPRMEDAGVFIATTVSFFLVEIGDKTQIATTALAARYHEVALVAIGTTIGLLIANLPLVWIGDRLADRLPVKTMRYGAALLFLAFAVLTYFFA